MLHPGSSLTRAYQNRSVNKYVCYTLGETKQAAQLPNGSKIRVIQSSTSHSGYPTNNRAGCCTTFSCTSVYEQEGSSYRIYSPLHPVTSCSRRRSTTEQLRFGHGYVFANNPAPSVPSTGMQHRLTSSRCERNTHGCLYKNGYLIVMQQYELRKTTKACLDFATLTRITDT